MAEQPARGRGKRVALIAGGVGVTLLVLAFLLVYFVIFPTSSPKPFKLGTAPSSPAGTSTQNSSPPMR